MKRSPRVSSQGHIEIDTIVRFVNGLKLYIINAVDIYTRFEFAYSYKTLTSKNGSDLLDKLFTVYPGKIHTIQTDNGLEFHKYFHTNLEKRGIKHVYIYPRC
ncbi:transposase, partial [mine drainage metagenome]